MEVKEKRRRLEKHKNDTNDWNIRGSLPEEIVIYEILPRVPIKSLFRFKLVSKKWCNVILEDRNFQGLQCRRCPCLPPGLLYFKVTNNKATFFPIIGPHLVDMLDPSHLVAMPDPSLKYLNISDGRLHSSSNGLICGSYNLCGKRYYYVSNPITRKCVIIPNLNASNDVAIASMVVNGTSSFLLVSCNADVRIPSASSKWITEIGFTLYSSKTGMWSRANAEVLTSKWFGSFPSRIRSVFTSGKFYWELGKEVLWFDIKKANAGVVAVPNEAERFPKGMIGDCGNELSYSMISTKTLNIEIWCLRSGDLKTDEFHWVKKHCLTLKKIFRQKGIPQTLIAGKKKDICNLIQVLPFEGGDLVMFWAESIMGIGKHVIFVYNIRSGSLKWICDSDP